MVLGFGKKEEPKVKDPLDKVVIDTVSTALKTELKGLEVEGRTVWRERETHRGAAIGIGCGVGIGIGLTGGLGLDLPFNVLGSIKPMFGLGVGCGLGLGYGYGVGVGKPLGRHPEFKKLERKLHQEGKRLQGK